MPRRKRRERRGPAAGRGRRTAGGVATAFPLGNRATARLAAAVQRAKSAEARSEKQRRAARAKATIQLLAGGFDANLAAHLFQAKKANGNDADHDDPGGLHAYTNGGLPQNIVAVGTQGSTGKVHTLTWRWNDSQVTKDSTMFPQWMPVDHVKTLVALKYREYSAGGQVHSDAAKTYIGRGQTFEIGRRTGQQGATVFPEG